MAPAPSVRTRSLLAGFAATLLAAGPALAQAPSTTLPKLNLPAPATAPSATSASPSGSSNAVATAGAQQVVQAPWIKICTTDPSTKKNVCAVRLEVHDSTGQQVVASATVRTVQDDPKMLLTVTVPTAMLIQPGLQVAIDTNKPIPLRYTLCVPNACFAETDFSADNLKALRAGKLLTIAALCQAGQQMTMPVSLGGFAKAYDGMTLDANSPSGKSALDALTTSLQQHAVQPPKR
jgi:invasion protein IalB